jgi:ABC-type transport system substrate-binding protein
VRFAEYWGEPAWAGRVVFRVLHGAAYADAVIAGHIDLGAHAPSLADLPRLASHRDVVVHRVAGAATYLGFNLAKPPLDDVRVRRALRQLLARERIVAGLGEAVLPGTTVGLSVAPDGVVTDAGAARRSLDEAGVRFERPLVLIVLEGHRKNLQVAELVAAEFGRAGVPIVVEARPNATFRGSSDYDLRVAGVIGLTPTSVPGFEVGDSARMGTNYPDADVVDLVRRADSLDPSTDEARDSYAQALRHVIDDAPSIYLFTEPRVTLARSWVVGWNVGASQEFAFQDLHLVSRR